MKTSLFSYGWLLLLPVLKVKQLSLNHSFPPSAQTAAVHVTFIADVKDFTVTYVTRFTLRMKNSFHMVPSGPSGQYGAS